LETQVALCAFIFARLSAGSSIAAKISDPNSGAAIDRAR
jgi:hypothetical protein